MEHMREEQRKPRYNLWQNTGYMIALAWRRQRSVLWLCLAIAALSIGTSLAELFIAPVILQKVERVVPLPELLGTIAGFAALLAALRGLSAYAAANTIFGRISVRSWLASALHEKYATTSYPNTEDASLLVLLKRAQTAVAGNSEATEAVWDTLTGLLKNLAGFLIYFFMISALDPLLVAVTLFTAAVGYFASRRIHEWGYRHRTEMGGYVNRLDYVCARAEDPKIAKDIRIFGMRSWLEDIYADTLRLYQAFITRRENVYIWANVIDVALFVLRNGIAYAYLLAFTLRENLPASAFLLYFAAIGGFTAWVTGLLNEYTTLNKQSQEISIVREFLEAPECFCFENGEALEPDPDGRYEIELRGVTFRYPGAERDALRGVNLIIQPGEKLAIVGLNGAGKTTLVKLICGFYDPTAGEVLLNGRDIRQYNRQDYYRHFSAVFQQFSVLEATLAENVAQTDRQIDYAKLSACIEKAGLTQRVERLPQRYETHIGRIVFEDGVELSGGEMQRLMLARALYKDAPIILLDEPTAALDPIAEDDIYHKYHELTQGRTSVYISHRLASTRFCDRILYMEDGVIAEEGTHAALMAAGGRYAQLFDVQSRYYKEECADGSKSGR